MGNRTPIWPNSGFTAESGNNDKLKVMKIHFCALTILLLLAGCSEDQQLPGPGTDTRAFEISGASEYTEGNLVATDALGRSLPTYDEVGGVKPNKQVAMFYWTWHTQQGENKRAYDASRIIAENPSAATNYYDPAWPQDGYYFYWGEPLFDYYIDTDPWVLRKHAEMLAEAGVDALFFDCTNGAFTWKESYMALCEVFQQAREDGVKVPKIAFMLAFGIDWWPDAALDDIYESLYKPGLYPDLWYRWQGKPVIMAYPEVANSSEIANFFTFRPGMPTYNDPPSRDDQWGWLQIYPQHLFGRKADGRYEMMTVGVAQNWAPDMGLSWMSYPGVFGRSYTNAKGYNDEEGAVDWGYNFQEQWDRAHGSDPDLVFITGWNEWIAIRGVRDGDQLAFADTFDQENSRDIEPMKGGHGDNYYYQLAANVCKFKGTEKPAPAPSVSGMDITDITLWDEIPAFRSYPGNTFHRHHSGWAGDFYTNTTGRNDIVLCKVAYDQTNLYFYVETASQLTDSGDPGWMYLLINSDRNHTTGWEGYDYIVNRTSPGAKAVLERSTGGWNWEKAAELDYTVNCNTLVVEIPRSALGVTGDIGLEFKWVDNMQKEGDIMDFYVSGDAAPLGRFNYLFIQ